MAVVDFWNNVLQLTTKTIIGYRGTITDFPHDLYSFLISTIRDADLKDVALIWRWMRGMQDTWENQYAQMNAIPNLYSPELVSVEILEYLKRNVGITKDLSYIWNTLDENGKRRFVKFFVRFITFRSTSLGLTDMLETMSDQTATIQNYFYFRWILSGDLDTETETALGRELEPNDPWLISELNMPTGILPHDLQLIRVGNDFFYFFGANLLVDALENMPIPGRASVTCLSTGVTGFGILWYDEPDWIITIAENYGFGQVLEDLSNDPQDFRLGFDIDPYTMDILIEDFGSLNRDLIVALAKFNRPMSERIFIRYYSLIEQFDNLDYWSTYGTVTVSDGIVQINPSSGIILTLSQAASWQNYDVTYKMKQTDVSAVSFRFMRQGTGDYYWFLITINTLPHIPVGNWSLYRRVSASNILMTSGTFTQLDIGVYYTWRIECFTSTRPGGDVQVIRVYQDENLIVEAIDSPVSWVGGAIGGLEILNGTDTIYVQEILVHPLPMEFDYVGP